MVSVARRLSPRVQFWLLLLIGFFSAFGVGVRTLYTQNVWYAVVAFVVLGFFSRLARMVKCPRCGTPILRRSRALESALPPSHCRMCRFDLTKTAQPNDC
jgi:hypothetical protein